LLHQADSSTPEDYYNQLRRYGYYFMKAGDYGEAIDAFERAIDTSVDNKFANALENAYLKSAMVECLMSTGDGTSFDNKLVANGSLETTAMSLGMSAYHGFHDNNLSSAPQVITNLGNVLELFSLHPEKLELGIPLLQQLLSQRNIGPGVKALAYYQAAQFANSCLEHGIHSIPLLAMNPTTQAAEYAEKPTQQIIQETLDDSLKAYVQLERKRTIVRKVNYNEGVIYNHLGLMAEKANKLDLAASNFHSALEKFVDNNENEAVAKVLFNLSDVRLKQHDLVAYYDNHRDAKRIWDGLLHPMNLSQIKKH